MKLNGIDLAGYSAKGNEATFTLEGVTMQDALNLNGQTLTVTQDEETYAIYAGYTIVEIEDQADGTIAMRAMRKLNDETEAAIIGLDQSVSLLTAKLDTVETAASDAATSATEAKASADDAAAKAEEAKQTAEQAGTDLQVSAFARIAVAPMAKTMSDAQVLEVSTLLAQWATGTEYETDDAVRDADGGVYRCEQDHTSSDQNNLTVASLWTKISIASDGIDVWQQPTGAHNAYSTGDKVHYPTADGPVYESTINGNCWSPTAYPAGWQLVEDAEQGGEQTDPEPSVPEFVQPTGAHDAYSTGDRVTYNGKVYESTMDGNVYSPDAYPQGWTLVE